jgi:F-type H+-transporting ATPase subunit epsilon
MANTIQCDIVSAHERVYSGDAAMFIASGAAGELGIAPSHAPLMTTLKPGPVRVIKPDGEEIVFFASGGILEVMPHVVTLLADTAVRADHLDAAAAVRAKEEAERELQTKTTNLEIAAAQAKLAEALAQLEALKHQRRMVKHNR